MNYGHLKTVLLLTFQRFLLVVTCCWVESRSLSHYVLESQDAQADGAGETLCCCFTGVFSQLTWLDLHFERLSYIVARLLFEGFTYSPELHCGGCRNLIGARCFGLSS